MRKTAFAFDRESYKDHIWEYVFGGLGEYFKAELARANNYPTYIFYWDNEVSRLVDSQLPGWIDAADTKGTFDRKVAIAEAVDQVRAQSNKKWNYAINEIAKQLKVRPNDLRLPNRTELEAAFFTRALENAFAAVEE